MQFSWNALARRLRAPAVMLAVAGLVAGCGLFPDKYEPPQQPSFYRSLVAPGSEVDSAAAAAMFSGYRRNNGLQPVIIDPVLTKMAKDQARAMAERNQVGHDVGLGPLDRRAKAAGYDYKRIAENVAGGYHTLAEAFSGWRDSPEHRKNTLMPAATRLGIAVAQAPGTKYKVFWAMIVAEPDDRPGPPPVIGQGGPVVAVPAATRTRTP